MRGLWLLLLLVCLPLSAARALDTTVIIAFGDSLFAGYGIGPEDAFPDQLERRLKENGYNVNLINMGISGDTTAGGEARLGRILAMRPDIALVGLGANDMLRGVKPDDTRASLNRILFRLHKAGIRTIVFGEKAPRSYGKDFAKAYDPLFCDLAKKYDAPCYPFFLKAAIGKPELMQADGMHPNPKGVTAIVDDVYPMVVKMVKK